MSKETGGPAFPLHNDTVIGVCVNRGESPEGMTLRDYFAGQALIGMLSHSADIGGNGNWANNAMAAEVAKDAYAYSDAMIAERNK